MSEPVAVIAPLYRTAAVLEELVSRLRAAVPEARVLLVDDGCPEGSGAVALGLAARDEAVTVVRHERNRGQQEAVRTGLRATAGCTRVVMDADLQDPPEAVPRLLVALRAQDVAAVFAGRRGAYEGPVRRAGGVVHRGLLHVALGLPFDAGGFVALRDRCAQAVLALDGPPQLVAMIGRTGMPTASVPVARRPRPEGSSTIGTRGRLRHAAAALEHVRRAASERAGTGSRGDDVA